MFLRLQKLVRSRVNRARNYSRVEVRCRLQKTSRDFWTVRGDLQIVGAGLNGCGRIRALCRNLRGTDEFFVLLPTHGTTSLSPRVR